jgi:hypothetical protein
MDVADNVRPRYHKILVAALKRRTAKIVRREVALLQHRKRQGTGAARRQAVLEDCL